VLSPLRVGAVSLPHTFTNGTVADAEQVNANFDALSNAIDAIETEVSTGTSAVQLGVDKGCPGQGYAWINFERPFTTPPVFIGTIDESLDNNGSVWARVAGHHENHVGIRCDHSRGTDQFYWLGIEPGTHTIDGKMVQAGIANNVSTSGGASFLSPFSTPPVVLLFPDESNDDNGAVQVRVISNSTTGFTIWANTTAEELHWVAMEAGDYDHDKWLWRAGEFDTAGDNCGAAAGCVQPFGRTFDHTPGVVGTIYDTNNNGAIWHRVVGSSDSSVTIRENDSGSERYYYVAYQRKE
jgi:hypothetical protein